MFGIGMPEMILILAIALIVIGPKKLPDLAKYLGRAIGEFKNAASDFKESIDINSEIKDVKNQFEDMNDSIKHVADIKPGDREDKPSDMPNEEPSCRFQEKVRVRAYPCRERNGVVWTYLGPRAKPPPLPEFEWNMDPDNVPFFWRNYRACNWVQALEGDIDSSHLNYLHRSLDGDDPWTVPGKPLPGFTDIQLPLVKQDGAPVLEVTDTEFGAMYGARRRIDDERAYWRIRPFLFPFHTMVGGGLDDREVCYSGKAWVPMDDTQTLVFEWRYRPGRPWTDEEREQLRQNRAPWGFAEPSSMPAGAWRPKAHAGNDYFLDRSLESSKLFCGILSSPLQDAAMQESMGPICDRTREHLGPADAMIIQVRRKLLRAARAWRDKGITPPAVDRPDLYRVRPVAAILRHDADWIEATKSRRRAP
jgi:Tat protein translocase TatB subunit